MTRAPWVLPKPDRAYPVANTTAVSTALGWRLRQPADAGGVDGLARRGATSSCSRSSASRASGRTSSRRARTSSPTRAWNDGFYDPLVVPVPDVDLARDEGIRPGSTAEKLAALKPSFRKDGTITAGNASPLNDGASAVLLGSAGAADRLGREPVARIAGRGAFALDPQDFGYAPVEAAEPCAGPRRHRLGRRRRGRAQRGLRGAVAGLRRRLEDRPADRQHPRRRDRHRPPAGRLRRPGARHPRRGAARGTGCAGAWPRSASASGRVWPWCSRTSTRRASTHDRRPGRRATPTRRSPGIEDGATVLIGGFGTAGQPVELIDALRRHGGAGADGRQQQRRQRRPRAGGAAQGRPGPQDRLLVPAAVRLLGLRRAVPGGTDRAGARAAGQPRRTHAGGRRGHRRVLLPHRCRHPARRGQGGPHHRRPRLRARVPDPRRRRADQGPPRRHAPATSSTARPPATSAPSWPPPRRPPSCRSPRWSSAGALDPEAVVTPGIYVDRIVAIDAPAQAVA